MTYYRNRATGKVSFHPKSGLGETFNADEIGEDGKPVKPRTSLAPSADELKRAKELLKDNSGTPLEQAAAEALIERAADTKTTGSKPAAGDSKQEGVN